MGIGICIEYESKGYGLNWHDKNLCKYAEIVYAMLMIIGYLMS